MRKKLFGILFVLLMTASILAGCTSTVDKPCMYCKHRPSKEYKKSDGTFGYVCEDCSSECMICSDEKATKHYESLLGIVFVCDDCYKAATGE